MDDGAVLDGLLRSKVFAGLRRGDLEPFASRGEIRSFAAGEIVVREGVDNDHLFVVVEGELDVFLPVSPERLTRVRLGTLAVGDCVGEYSFLDHNPTSASVAAAQPTRLWTVAQAAFERFLEESPTVGGVVYRNLLVLLIERLRANVSDLDVFRPIG